MNVKQTRAIQRATNPDWIKWQTGAYFEGSLAFNVTEIGDKVLVHGSNTESIEWFQRQFIVQIVVGPKGGLNEIKVY